MSQNLIINDVKYNNVESISLFNENGDKISYKEDTGAAYAASVLLSERLNYYTGETGVMTIEEIAEKIDLILCAITNDKSEFRERFHYSANIVNFPNLDTKMCKNFSYMYHRCEKEGAIFPDLDTRNGESFSYMYATTKGSRYPSYLDTSNGITFDRMFYGSNIISLPLSDTSNGTNFNRLCDSCYKLESAKVNLSKAENVTNIFYNCEKLRDLIIDGIIYISGIDLKRCTSLSHDSLMSVINALADYSSDTSGTTHSLVLGATNLAKLSDEEKAIATQKGWTLS